MSRNVWRALGEAGERHVRGRIDEIGLSLSRALAPEVKGLDGGVWTVAPVDTPAEALECFEDGVSASATVDESLIDPVVQWLGHTLASLLNGAVLFEQAMWRAGDPIVERSEHVVACGEELYTLIPCRRATIDVLENAFTWGMARCEGLALIVDQVEERDLVVGPRRLRQNAAQALAGRLVGVIVEAYDGEGAAIWVKSQWRPV